MNFQTIKPRARWTMDNAQGRYVWRIAFPDSYTRYKATSLDEAIALAFRSRLTKITTASYV